MRLRTRVRAASLLAALVLAAAAATTAEAQELEPRAFANTPVGLNFVVAGYAYTQGSVSLDSLPITDATLSVHAALAAYVRTLDVFGHAGKVDLVLPYAWLSGSAKVAGVAKERVVDGPGDPRLRFSVLLYGAPALTLKEFESYEPDLIVGASFAMTAPLGQYDSDKLVNIGTNRWSFKPEVGVAKTWGPFTLELSGAATFYTDNPDFFGGHTLEREPLVAAQAHAIYHTRFGLWVAVDATYYFGGTTIVDGERGERQEHLRVGITLAIPVNRYNSIKLYGSTGAIARGGGNYNSAGIAWQVRWGGGL
jgi:outer membrane putative beta-barrel porin/alpha-amylase